MKERPILFSAPMVRAILDGRKTQTRRIVKPQPDFLGSMDDPTTPWKTLAPGLHEFIVCPYGKPGDRLWVRETHAPQPDCMMAWDNWMLLHRTGPKPIIHYAADGGDPWVDRWRPSIHMPRWASRITLEVIGVRVERLKTIRTKDAQAEGVFVPSMQYAALGEHSHRFAFGSFWEQINGSGSWDANPWVWVIEFRTVTQ